MQNVEERRRYLQDFLRAFAYPQEAITALLETYDTVCAGQEEREIFFRLVGVYEENMLCDFALLAQEIEVLSRKLCVNVFALQAVFYMLLTQKLKAYYLENGVEQDVWEATAGDLKIKCLECKQVKGIWGIFAIRWFFNLFRMNVFRLGRLEFCLRSFGAEYEKDGLVLHADTLVIDTHIPSGEPLVYGEVLQSYGQAISFFKQYRGVEAPAFWCKSWLLSPVNKVALSEKSNIRKFADDFDVYECLEYPDYTEIFLRVFNKEYVDGYPLDALPCDTAIQKFYVKWMKQRKITSAGKGVLDCKKVLKKLQTKA